MSLQILPPNCDRRTFVKLAGAGLFLGAPLRWLLPGAAAEAAMPSCIVRPEQTAGPFFVDNKLHRSDIRSEPADGSVVPGVPLRLTFEVSRLEGSVCAPLPGAIVDVWQCDALGVYSGVRDSGRRTDTRGKSFLRGFQTTNIRGQAEFLTIYPGWYPGRAVHIHFKIRRTFQHGGAVEFTSQLYFDEAMSDQVFKQSPYSGQRGSRVLNDDDALFRRGGKELLLKPTKGLQGYSARFDIGLKIDGA